MANRKAAQEFWLDFIEELVPGGQNKEIYQKFFDSMDDAQFEAFVSKIENGSANMAIWIPNFAKSKVSTKNNLKIAEKYGIKFFQKVWIPAKQGVRKYLTPKPYLILDLPVRRQAQLHDKKISIPENNNSVDYITGQPTGASKGAKISFPELQVLTTMGLDKTAIEFMKIRGGDSGSFNALNAVMDRNGSVSQAEIEPYSTGVKSTKALKHMLLGMGLKPTGL